MSDAPRAAMSDAPRAAMSDTPRAAMSDAQTTLAGIVSEAVGPLPRVCTEQVLRDLERARMTAEDFRAGNSVCTVYGETFRQRVASQSDHIEMDQAYMVTLHHREQMLDETIEEHERTIEEHERNIHALRVILHRRERTIEEHERTLRAVTSERDWARIYLRGVGIFARLTHAEDALNGIRMVLRRAGEDTTAEDEDTTAEDEEGNMDVGDVE